VAGRHDFDLVAGTDFAVSLEWLGSDGIPIDLTGWSANCQVRNWPGGDLLADMSTAGGQITLGGTAGTITLSLPAADTAGIPAGVAKYDLLMTNLTPATSCLLFGDVIVRAAVTQVA